MGFINMITLVLTMENMKRARNLNKHMFHLHEFHQHGYFGFDDGECEKSIYLGQGGNLNEHMSHVAYAGFLGRPQHEKEG
jgi:hypothetical protein